MGWIITHLLGAVFLAAVGGYLVAVQPTETAIAGGALMLAYVPLNLAFAVRYWLQRRAWVKVSARLTHP